MVRALGYTCTMVRTTRATAAAERFRVAQVTSRPALGSTTPTMFAGPPRRSRGPPLGMQGHRFSSRHTTGSRTEYGRSESVSTASLHAIYAASRSAMPHMCFPRHGLRSWRYKRARIVSRPTCATSVCLSTCSVMNRTVQRAAPSGGSAHTTTRTGGTPRCPNTSNTLMSGAISRNGRGGRGIRQSTTSVIASQTVDLPCTWSTT